MTPPTNVLELHGIAKAYEGNRVLKGVSLNVARGSIHALVGENGAGKSTLMNILFGMPVIRETGGYQGKILLDGVEQRLVFGPKLETLDFERVRKDSRDALDRVGLGVDEWMPVAGLPVGHMQFIEIAREVDKRNARLLIFDEPTAVLAESEATELLKVMKSLAARGLGILFITHRLDEVLAVADQITVLRDGEVVAQLDPRTTTVGRIAELMVGRPAAVVRHPDAHERQVAAPALEIEDLTVEMPGESVHGVSFSVDRGEVLGIGGLAGQGKIGIANGLMGLFPARGKVRKDGKPLALNDPRAAIRAGLAFVSEDRRGVGILPDESIELNIALTAIEAQNRFLLPGPVASLRLLDGPATRHHALEMIRSLDIRCTGPRQHVRRLSGGNQQKVCLARAMTLEPDTLLVSEPTRGIDVGAKERVLEILRGLNRERGLTLIVTSSELAELRSICTRIAIVYGGRIAAILPPDASDESIGLAMAGETVGHHA
jgi:simple sugar transport system ATP-binding protein